MRSRAALETAVASPAPPYARMNALWETFEADVHRKSEQMGVTFTNPDKAPFIGRAAVLKREFGDDAELTRLIEEIAQA